MQLEGNEICMKIGKSLLYLEVDPLKSHGFTKSR